MCDGTWLLVERGEGLWRVLHSSREVLGQEAMCFHVVAASGAVDRANAEHGFACIPVVVH